MLTMTETWMSSRGGRQPDSHHDLYGDSAAGDPNRHMRSSLGQLIERSISAPPSSDSNDEPSQSYSMRNVSLFSISFDSGKGTRSISYVCHVFVDVSLRLCFSPCYGVMHLLCQLLHPAPQQAATIHSPQHQLYRTVEPVWKDSMTISPHLEAPC